MLKLMPANASPADFTENRSFSIGGDIRDGGVVCMTPAEWSKIPDNPRQRNTELHARKARKEHLSASHPTHRKVSMALLPDGRRFKVDGHTRCWLWDAGELEAPAVLDVQVWLCPDLAAVKELYSTFDNVGAVETTPDQMFGAHRELEIQFESDFLKSQRYANALRFATELLFGQAEAKRQKVYDLLRYWLPELRLLDACGPHRDVFIAGIAAGALISFRRFGQSASEFWTGVARNAGNKVGEDMDAVHALLERIQRLKAAHKVNGRPDREELVCICLSAFDRYRDGLMYVTAKGGGIKQYGQRSLDQWLTAAKNAQRKW